MGWALQVLPCSDAAATTLETALQDTVPADSVTKHGWWTVGMETSNNSSFFGRNTAKQYPYAAVTFTYAHQTGLWASATAYQLFNTEAYIDETDLSLGYSFKIRKRIDANLSYSHFIFSENSPLVKAVTSNAANAYAALDWNVLYTALTASYIFGGSNDVFVVLENSRYIPLNPLWKGKRTVGLDPVIGITAGTQQFSESHTVITEQRKQGVGNAIGDPLGGILDPLNPKKGNSGNNGNGNSTSTTTTTTTNRFKVLNYEVKVPLVISLGNFEVEPAYRYAIPVNKLEGDESLAQSFYSLNVNYTF